LFIYDFRNIIDDFKILSTQYDYVILYWNKIKILFILPNSTNIYNLNNTEEFFNEHNNKVFKIYNYRIKKYKKLSKLYDILLSPSKEKDIFLIDFCLGHKKCHEIKKSNKYLLSNGIDSAVNLYAKEISNYYQIYLYSRNNITMKNDIIKTFINDKFLILSMNINHIFIFLEEIYFKYFLQDEEDIINNFHFKIKDLNIIEISYCILLNLFSFLFVYNYINKIINSIEISSKRINYAITRLKSGKSNRNY
jgi:hypothetical protein